MRRIVSGTLANGQSRCWPKASPLHTRKENANSLHRGCAGVLREVGLPDDAAFWALLLFNVGLEIGQLIVVAVCLFLGFLIRNWQRKITAVQDLSLGNLLPAYFIGPISVWWLLQRLPVLG